MLVQFTGTRFIKIVTFDNESFLFPVKKKRKAKKQKTSKRIALVSWYLCPNHDQYRDQEPKTLQL